MTEDQAEDIKRVYLAATELPCTCYSDPERACPHCSAWGRAEKLVDKQVDTSPAVREFTYTKAQVVELARLCIANRRRLLPVLDIAVSSSSFAHIKTTFEVCELARLIERIIATLEGHSVFPPTVIDWVSEGAPRRLPGDFRGRKHELR